MPFCGEFGLFGFGSGLRSAIGLSMGGGWGRSSKGSVTELYDSFLLEDFHDVHLPMYVVPSVGGVQSGSQSGMYELVKLIPCACVPFNHDGVDS